MIRQDWSTLKKLIFAKTAAAGAALAEDTATGNPLTFLTDLAKPLKSLLIPFTPVQSGTGDPSPSNVRDIVPWEGLTVKRGGKNLLNVASENVDRASGTYTYTEGAIHTEVVGAGNSGYVVFKQKFPAGTYTLSCSASGGVAYANLLLDIPVSGWEYVSYYGGYVKAAPTGVVTIAANSDFHIGIILKTGTAGTAGTIDAIQLEIGSTATAYSPYVSIAETDISFPSPVYGGTLDVVSGVLTVDWIGETYDGSEDESWNVENGNNFYIMTPSTFPRNTTDSVMICNTAKSMGSISSVGSCKITASGNFNIKIGSLIDVSTVEGFKTWLSTNNVQVVVKLAEPQTVQLTGEQITALKGDNTLWSDANGQMTAVFFKKG